MGIAMEWLGFYIAVFVTVGAFFLFIHLVMGKVIRPYKPDSEKLTIYECGEPTVGSAWIQFDLRYYVVALLFVIFDVEVAFFFPWAVVFGQANSIAKDELPTVVQAERLLTLTPTQPPSEERQRIANLLQAVKEGDTGAEGQLREALAATGPPMATLSRIALLDIAVFFGVLLVGFAYLWKRGDLAWVRSTAAERLMDRPLTSPLSAVGRREQLVESV